MDQIFSFVIYFILVERHQLTPDGICHNFCNNLQNLLQTFKQHEEGQSF